jgi:hypothetical protein
VQFKDSAISAANNPSISAFSRERLQNFCSTGDAFHANEQIVVFYALQTMPVPIKAGYKILQLQSKKYCTSSLSIAPDF